MSETMGRCRSEVDDCYGGLPLVAIADAIDRLAADVAAIKAAILPQTTEERDAAISERDEALAEIERLRQSRDAADRLNGATLAEVERLKNELYDREQEILSLRADTVERYEPIAAPRPAQVSDPPPAAPAAGWLTQEERRILSAHVQALRDQRRAIERGGQTLVYSEDFCGLKREADAIDALLARAGSPPVVEVPAMRQPGPMTIREKQIHVAYRDALDAAGVPWKEVGRE